jgi:hypothetical protein
MKGTWSMWLRGALGVALMTGLASTAFAQGAGKAPWKQGKTADGQPDMEGIYLLFDPTPFEAPGAPPRTDEMPAQIGPADDFAIFNHKQQAKRRSMVVDPPDGFVPVMKWAEDERDYHLAHLPDAPEHETPWVRCVTRGYPAGMFPAGYNNAVQVWQTPGYVILNMEMIHETRIIPIDGRPKLNEKIKQWNGEPRGHWEGNTLVVESTNYNNKGSVATSAHTGRIRGLPQSEQMTITERFTRVDEETLDYSVQIKDPKVYTRPWTVAIPLVRDDTYQMYEYSCHEGNYAMANSLSFGRKRDAEEAAAKAAAKTSTK